MQILKPCEIVMGIFLVVVNDQGIAVCKDRVVDAPQRFVYVAQIIPGSRIVAVEFDDAGKGVECLPGLALLNVEAAEVEQSLEMIGVDREGLPVLLYSFIEHVMPVIRGGEKEMRLCGIGVHFDGLSPQIDGPVVISLHLRNIGEIDEGLHVPGVDLEGMFVHLLRAAETVHLFIGVAEVDICLDISRFKLDDAGEILKGLVVLLPLEVDKPKVHICIRVAGIQLDAFPVSLDGLVDGLLEEMAMVRFKKPLLSSLFGRCHSISRHHDTRQQNSSKSCVDVSRESGR